MRSPQPGVDPAQRTHSHNPSVGGAALVILAIIAALLTAVGPQPAAAQGAKCAGRTATIIGTGLADQITGTNGDDVIIGGPGNDRINGNGGNDVICGGAGINFIDGGAGNDIILGGPTTDVLSGGPGNDVMRGGLGHDQLRGGDGFDRIFGGNGNDYLNGENGVDWVNGGSGADFVIGAAGNDVLAGNRGRDRVFGGTEADRIFGGDDVDYLNGGPGNDTIRGGDGDDRLIGWTGEDTLYGGDGNDIIGGGTANDSLFGGNGADLLDGGDQFDTCNDADPTTTRRNCETLPPAGPPTRIMPLGDSITAGVTANPSVPRIATQSYRPTLWNSLAASNCKVDFVGSRKGTDSGLTFAPPFDNPTIDVDHEGYSGWNTNQIRFNARSWAQAANPDVVMLMIGTNDILQGTPANTSISNIALIVSELRAANPSVVVLLAEVPPLDPPNPVPNANGVQELNSALPALVSQISTSTSPVRLVQMVDELNISQHYQDGIHPDFRGEPIMAAQWKQALLPFLPSC